MQSASTVTPTPSSSVRPPAARPQRRISNALPALPLAPLGIALKPADPCGQLRGRPLAQLEAATRRGDVCAAEALADALTSSGETVADYERAASLTAAVLEVRPRVDFWWLCALFDLAHDYDRLARCQMWLEPERVSLFHALGLTSIEPPPDRAMTREMLTRRLEEDLDPEYYPPAATASDLYCSSGYSSNHDFGACAAERSIIEGYRAAIGRPLAFAKLPPAERDRASAASLRYAQDEVTRQSSSYSIGTSGGIRSMCSIGIGNVLRRAHDQLLRVLAGLEPRWVFAPGALDSLDRDIADRQLLPTADLSGYRGEPPGSEYRAAFEDAERSFADYERAVLDLARKVGDASLMEVTRTRLRQIRKEALEPCPGRD